MMLRRMLGALVLALPGLAAEPAPPGQDLVLFTPDRPLLLRARVLVDGRPIEAACARFLDRVFRYLDTDGDGILDRKEIAQMPADIVLAWDSLGRTKGGALSDLDSNHDGQITRAEVAAFVRQQARMPRFHAESPVSVNPQPGYSRRRISFPESSDTISGSLFNLLDTNQDGRLSREELKAGATLLRKRDADDNELVSLSEIIPGEGQVNVPYRSAPMAGTPPPGSLAWVAGEAKQARVLARELSRRYGNPEDPSQKLRREQLGLDEETFARLDANRDGVLDTDELVHFTKRPPDLEIVVRLGQGGANEEAVEIVRWTRKGVSTGRGPDRKPYLEIGTTRLVLQTESRPDPRFTTQTQTYHLAQFKAADRDGNGYLDRREAGMTPLFMARFDLMDRNGDGKLTRKELVTYLNAVQDMRDAAQVTWVTLHYAEEGKGLFDLIDSNGDGQLSPRELQHLDRLIDQLDRDGDGQVSRAEIPRVYRASFRSGSANDGGGRFPVRFVVSARLAPVPPVPQRTKGPLWFRKMDRNQDGDVSRREFLGSEADFRRIDTDGDGLISRAEAERADRTLRQGTLNPPTPPGTRGSR